MMKILRKFQSSQLFSKRVLGPLLVLLALSITTLTFSMTVNANGVGALSSIISLLLDEEEVVDGEPPVADAGTDIDTFVGELVFLDGSNSDVLNDQALSYLWSFSSLPLGSTAVLSADTSSTPSFIIDVAGAYIVELVVNDGANDSLVDEVVITTSNRAPTADAGADNAVALGEVVSLDAAGSFDLDGDPISYLWNISSAPIDSIATLDDDTALAPEFTPDIRGNYVIDLVVNDGLLDSEIDQVEVFAGIELTLELADVFFGVSRTTQATISLNQMAPVAGLTINFSADDPFVTLGETPLQFLAGETEKLVDVTGLAPGETVLRASGDNIEEVSVDIQVTAALVSVGQIDVIAPSEMTSVVVSISDPAPAPGLTVNLESLDPSVATVSPTTVFVPTGQLTPTENAQVTGVGFGSTALRATALAYAPDIRDITVALEATFSPSSLSVPELQTREIVVRLDSPAPVGGITFDLSLIGAGPDFFSIPDQISIAEGQTQSPPIEVNGLLEGVATLRASATDFVNLDTVVTVTDAPDAYLSRFSGSAHLEEAITGIDLQTSARIRLQIPPTAPVDIRLSVPADSGVLLSANRTLGGSNVLLLEDIVSTATSAVYIQGVELTDDVDFTIEVFDANTTNVTAYEILSSTIDVDPSGVYITSSDFTTSAFSPNRSIQISAAVLFDDEMPDREGDRSSALNVRGGFDLSVAMEVDQPIIAALPGGATGNIVITGGDTSETISVDPLSVGIATISISEQPRPGFTLPLNEDDELVATIDAPTAFLSSFSSSSHLVEAIVGVELQSPHRIRLEATPPTAVDIVVSVGADTGVLLSSADDSVGTSQIVLSGITSTVSPAFFIQGESIGDDVPFSIEVFDTGTETATGYDVLASTVDVDPSGVHLTSTDYTTTTFSVPRAAVVSSSVLFDNETPASLGRRRATQSVRGGPGLVVPMQVDNPLIASLPNGANDDLFILAGDTSGQLLVDPLSAGQATISIQSQPPGFTLPDATDDNVVVTIEAADAFLRRQSSNNHQAEAIVGIDLQSVQRIGFAVAPPAPVDVIVSVVAGNGVLLSTDQVTAGSDQIMFEDVSFSFTPPFYIQGTMLGDDVDLTIDVFDANTTNPSGYNVLPSTVDVDPSGVFVTTSDFEITTFSSNRQIQVSTSVLHDIESAQNGNRLQTQVVRGGLNLAVAMQVDQPMVAALPAGMTDTLNISAGSSSGSIELDPLTAGQAIASIVEQPRPDFVLPANADDNVIATVDAPEARLSAISARLGDELQQSFTVRLEVAPPNPVDVTVEIIAPTVALVSSDAAQVGSGSVVYSGVSTTVVGSVVVQALELGAATQIRVSAPGYSDWLADLEIVDSGFRINGSSTNMNVGETRDFIIRTVRLNPNSTVSVNQVLRAGASFEIDVVSSLPGVGVVTSPVTLVGGAVSETTTFTAVSPGTTEISISQPSGFTPPAGQTDIDITVD